MTAAVIPCPVQQSLWQFWGMLASAASPKPGAAHHSPRGVVSGAVNQETRAYCASHTPTCLQLCWRGHAGHPWLLHRRGYSLSSRAFPAAMSLLHMELGPWHTKRPWSGQREGVPAGLWQLCFYIAFSWRDALPQQIAKTHFLCKLFCSEAQRNMPGVTASNSPLFSALSPWFQGAEAFGLQELL